MAGDTDLMLDGFRLLEKMPVEEIKLRISWLEETLGTYKMLLAVRLVMEKRPEGMTVPPQWESAVDMHQAEKRYAEPKPQPTRWKPEEPVKPPTPVAQAAAASAAPEQVPAVPTPTRIPKLPKHLRMSDRAPRDGSNRAKLVEYIKQHPNGKSVQEIQQDTGIAMSYIHTMLTKGQDKYFVRVRHGVWAWCGGGGHPDVIRDRINREFVARVKTQGGTPSEAAEITSLELSGRVITNNSPTHVLEESPQIESEGYVRLSEVEEGSRESGDPHIHDARTVVI